MLSRAAGRAVGERSDAVDLTILRGGFAGVVIPVLRPALARKPPGPHGMPAECVTDPTERQAASGSGHVGMWLQ